MNDCFEIIPTRIPVHLRIVFDAEQLTFPADDPQHLWFLPDGIWIERNIADHVVFELFSHERFKGHRKEAVLSDHDNGILTENTAPVANKIRQGDGQPRSRGQVGDALEIQRGRKFVVLTACRDVERGRAECLGLDCRINMGRWRQNRKQCEGGLEHGKYGIILSLRPAQAQRRIPAEIVDRQRRDVVLDLLQYIRHPRYCHDIVGYLVKYPQ